MVRWGTVVGMGSFSTTVPENACREMTRAVMGWNYDTCISENRCSDQDELISEVPPSFNPTSKTNGSTLLCGIS